MRTRDAIASLMMEMKTGSACTARYSGATTRPVGGFILHGDLTVAANATQVLHTGIDLRDRMIWLRAYVNNAGSEASLPGDVDDHYIWPTPFTSAGTGTTTLEEELFDRGYQLDGLLYTAEGWDGSSKRGLSGGKKFNYATFRANFSAAYAQMYIYVSQTGSLEFKNGEASPLGGYYFAIVTEQTGKRVAVP